MGKKIIVKGELLCNGNPWESDGMIVKLFDKDLLEDDFLGQSKITGHGKFEIEFYSEDFKSYDSPFESKPDLYFCIYLFGELLYRSVIWNDVDIDKSSIFVPDKGKVIDLGTFDVPL
jgi:hypothetical protein